MKSVLPRNKRVNVISKPSKLSEHEIRKIHFLGDDDCTCRVVIPSKFARHLHLANGTYLKLSLDEESDKITVEKLGDQK